MIADHIAKLIGSNNLTATFAPSTKARSIQSLCTSACKLLVFWVLVFRPEALASADDSLSNVTSVVQPVPPSVPEQIKAEQLVRDIYKTDFARTTAADRQALAHKLLEKAAGLTDDVPGLYVLLRDAREVAIAGHDQADAVSAVEQLHEKFEISLGDRLDDLSKLSSSITLFQPSKDLTEHCWQLSEEAITAEQYDVAVRAASLAKSFAGSTRDPHIISVAEHLLQQIRDLQQQYLHYQAALEKLKASPDDKNANLTVGTFLCFVKNDWRNGLANLVNGSDPDLADLASKDLGRPTSIQQAIELGDSWWEASGKQVANSSRQRGMQHRAAQCYTVCLDRTSGLEKDKLTTRIATARDSERSDLFARRRGDPIDLLSKIDEFQDAVSGGWDLTKDGVSTSVHEFSKLRLRYKPTGDYDFHIQFTRIQGTNDVVMMLSNRGRQFDWCMASFNDTATGFDIVGGKRVSRNDASIKERMGLINGHRYDCLVQVRHSSLKAYMDGKLLVQYSTNFADMDRSHEWDIQSEQLGIGCLSPTMFHVVEVTEVGPSIVDDYLKSAPAAAGAGGRGTLQKPIDLLATADLKDCIGGKWTSTNQGLVCDTDGLDRLRLAYEPHGEYDFRVRFTRPKGDGAVVLMLSHDGKRFMWGMGEFANTSMGFRVSPMQAEMDKLAGPQPHNNLLNNHRYECIVKVRADGLEAYLDGNQMCGLPTDYSDLRPPPLWDIGTDQLGIGCQDRTIFHAVEVVEIANSL